MASIGYKRFNSLCRAKNVVFATNNFLETRCTISGSCFKNTRCTQGLFLFLLVIVNEQGDIFD